jgi:hypothetical protein
MDVRMAETAILLLTELSLLLGRQVRGHPMEAIQRTHLLLLRATIKMYQVGNGKVFTAGPQIRNNCRTMGRPPTSTFSAELASISAKNFHNLTPTSSCSHIRQARRDLYHRAQRRRHGTAKIMTQIVTLSPVEHASQKCKRSTFWGSSGNFTTAQSRLLTRQISKHTTIASG